MSDIRHQPGAEDGSADQLPADAVADLGAEGSGEGKREARYASDPDRLFLPPDDDLAPNRPGEALRVRLAEEPRARAALWWARLLGRRPPQDDWHRQLLGEQAVGTALDLLTAGGWYVIHSVPMPPAAVIGHLLIGPGGVLCVGTHYVRGARVRVAEDAVRVSRGHQAFPYVRDIRQEARRASYVLTRSCRFRVETRPVLAFVGAAEVTLDPALRGVRVLRDEREAPSLGQLGGVLAPARVERVYTVARNRRTWLAA
ncbi:NERD nuclease [Streptomyces sp. WAC 06725]|uniref:nuclease-related domain-containing protein n=1 Tax=Streptomyces sp. WAC 06725 TaxID=2203209 RepID=UPI000F73AD7C|nr:nuclease-related domain-containing protein [Streptomyces sp. WAC 06725]RSO31748.1 NERD nuclease [Streptomyces sp. WAC 06725]